MIKTDKNLRETYKHYKKSVSNPVDYSVYRKINLYFYNIIITSVVKGETVSLPCSMGTMSVVGTKREKYFDEKGQCILPPDWVKTKALWNRDKEAKKDKRLVRHTNEDTGGVSYRLSWNKYNVPLRNKNFVSFRLTRKHKRNLSEIIKKGKEYKIVKYIK